VNREEPDFIRSAAAITVPNRKHVQCTDINRTPPALQCGTAVFHRPAYACSFRTTCAALVSFGRKDEQ